MEEFGKGGLGAHALRVHKVTDFRVFGLAGFRALGFRV